jgi:hypothetical protein
MGAKRDRLAGGCATSTAVDALNPESITGLSCQAALSGGGTDVRTVPVRVAVRIPVHVREPSTSASPAPSNGEAMLTLTEQEAIQVTKAQLKAQIALKLKQLSQEREAGQASQRGGVSSIDRIENGVTDGVEASAVSLHAPNAQRGPADRCSKTIRCKVQGPTMANIVLDSSFMIPRKHLRPQPTARPPPKVSFIA